MGGHKTAEVVNHADGMPSWPMVAAKTCDAIELLPEALERFGCAAKRRLL
jgi:hypothetical protein